MRREEYMRGIAIKRRKFRKIKIACIDQRDSGNLLCMLEFRTFKRIVGDEN